MREPHLSKLARQVTAEQVHAWRRYLQQSDIAPEHRTGYMIRRLYAGDAPPSEYDELVRRYVPLESRGHHRALAGQHLQPNRKDSCHAMKPPCQFDKPS